MIVTFTEPSTEIGVYAEKKSFENIRSGELVSSSLKEDALRISAPSKTTADDTTRLPETRATMDTSENATPAPALMSARKASRKAVSSVVKDGAAVIVGEYVVSNDRLAVGETEVGERDMEEDTVVGGLVNVGEVDV